jgi:uncharacterized protein YgiM (DUF1202 family)
MKWIAGILLLSLATQVSPASVDTVKSQIDSLKKAREWHRSELVAIDTRLQNLLAEVRERKAAGQVGRGDKETREAESISGGTSRHEAPSLAELRRRAGASIARDDAEEETHYYVTAITLNMRSGPGPDERIVRRVRRRDLVAIIDSESGWDSIRVIDGASAESDGWVREEFLGSLEEIEAIELEERVDQKVDKRQADADAKYAKRQAAAKSLEQFRARTSGSASRNTRETGSVARNLGRYRQVLMDKDIWGTLVSDLQKGSASSGQAIVTVTNAWHYQPYQVRYQAAQGLWKLWASIESPSASDNARIKLVDQMGNEVGGSRMWAGSMIWVQEK